MKLSTNQLFQLNNISRLSVLKDLTPAPIITKLQYFRRTTHFLTVVLAQQECRIPSLVIHNFLFMTSFKATLLIMFSRS